MTRIVHAVIEVVKIRGIVTIVQSAMCMMPLYVALILVNKLILNVVYLLGELPHLTVVKVSVAVKIHLIVYMM